MTQLERGRNTDEAATTLHPCWNAYRLKDEYVNVGLHPFIIYFTFCTLNIHFRRELVVYLNAFSGDATTEFPSTLEMARGGV